MSAFANKTGGLLVHLKSLKILLVVIAAVVLLAGMGGCAGVKPGQPAAPVIQPTISSTLTFYYWSDSIPQEVLDAFSKEYNVRVIYKTYGSQEEAIGKLQTSNDFDVVILDNDKIPGLISQNLAARMDLNTIPNIKNIAPANLNRDFDPGNDHAVMFHWGTTGILYRKDLIPTPVTRWIDLWDKAYAGKVVVYPSERDLLCIALKSIAHSCNTDRPEQLEEALMRLRELNPAFISMESISVAPLLNEGNKIIAYGWSYDGVNAREVSPDIAYVYPEDGTLLWAEYMVIPANSPHIYTAELFINFILRPEINAIIVNQTKYPSPLQSALPGIEPDILQDPIIFPPPTVIQNGEWELPLSDATQKMWDQVWNRFLSGN